MYNPFYSLIFAFALENYLKDGKTARRANKLYNWVISKGNGNAIVLTRTNEQRLLCNFSHQLPFYQKKFPLYDRQLSKLCRYLHDELNRTINIIDVGANVGDTVLNIGLKDAYYLCIEGNETFAKFIRKNLKRYSYSLENCYLTDNPDEKNYHAEVTNGTGRLIVSNDFGGDVLTQTFDQLIESKYKEKKFDLIKIDTDGFDFKVIRGAKKCIQEWNPLLYFEWDKAYCKEQGEDPLSIFPLLEGLGYSECILFDNIGNLVDLVPTNNLKKLGEYIEKTIGDGLPYYYDVLVVSNKGNFSASQFYKLF